MESMVSISSPPELLEVVTIERLVSPAILEVVNF